MRGWRFGGRTSVSVFTLPWVDKAVISCDCTQVQCTKVGCDVVHKNDVSRILLECLVSQAGRQRTPQVSLYARATVQVYILHYIYSTDRHVLAIMQADLCRAHPHNQEVMSLYLLKA
jgi:hypothetical protein